MLFGVLLVGHVKTCCAFFCAAPRCLWEVSREDLALKHPRQTTRCCSLYCIYLVIYTYICTYAIQILSILCMIFTTYYIIDNTCHALKHFHTFLNCLARWQSSCHEMWWTGLIFVSMQTVESLFSSIRGITCLCSIAVAACSQKQSPWCSSAFPFGVFLLDADDWPDDFCGVFFFPLTWWFWLTST